MSIQTELLNINKELPLGTQLVAVSKYHPAQTILEAYEAGQCVFGESKVQELIQKQTELPKDIQWHFIGHLQTNKVKYIVPFVSLIHSVDTFKLLKEINKQGAKINRQIPCLLQIHIAKENTKYGFSFQECRDLLSNESFKELQHIHICGLMGMGTNTNDSLQVENEFKQLSDFQKEIKNNYFADREYYKELSMGMSSDYTIALKYGATLIRIGTRIFGAREY